MKQPERKAVQKETANKKHCKKLWLAQFDDGMATRAAGKRASHNATQTPS